MRGCCLWSTYKTISDIKNYQVVCKITVPSEIQEKIHSEAANLEQYAHQLKAKPFRFLLQAFILLHYVMAS